MRTQKLFARANVKMLRSFAPRRASTPEPANVVVPGNFSPSGEKTTWKRRISVQGKRGEPVASLREEKLALRKMLADYNTKIIDRNQRKLMQKMKSRETVIDAMDTSHRRSLVLSVGGKDVSRNECVKREPSKYQTNLELEVQMRRAFNKTLAMAEPDEEERRLLELAKRMLEARNEPSEDLRKEQDRWARRVHHQEKMAELLYTAKTNIRGLAARDDKDPRDGNRALQDLFYAIKCGNKLEVEDMLDRNPGLLSETNSVSQLFVRDMR